MPLPRPRRTPRRRRSHHRRESRRQHRKPKAGLARNRRKLTTKTRQVGLARKKPESQQMQQQSLTSWKLGNRAGTGRNPGRSKPVQECLFAFGWLMLVSASISGSMMSREASASRTAAICRRRNGAQRSARRSPTSPRRSSARSNSERPRKGTTRPSLTP